MPNSPVLQMRLPQEDMDSLKSESERLKLPPSLLARQCVRFFLQAPEELKQWVSAGMPPVAVEVADGREEVEPVPVIISAPRRDTVVVEEMGAVHQVPVGRPKSGPRGKPEPAAIATSLVDRQRQLRESNRG